MEENKYLNKTLKDIAKISKQAGSLKKTLDNQLPKLKEDIRKQGGDTSQITKMQGIVERAIESGDLSTLLKAKKDIL